MGALDDIDGDPQRLDAVEDRLATLERLERRYGGSLAAVRLGFDPGQWEAAAKDGTPVAVTALLGGQVQALASGPAAAVGQIKGGKMRALASWGTERLKLLPEIPTFKELGYDVEYFVWSGAFAPAATPTPVMNTLRDAIRRGVASTEFKTAMANLKSPDAYLDAPEFAAFLKRDAVRLEQAIQKIGKVE